MTICLLLTMMPAAVLADATGIATGTDLDDPGQNNPGVEVTPGPGEVQAPVQNPGTPVLLSEGNSISITDDNSITSDGTHVQGETLTAVLSDTTDEWSYQWYQSGSPVAGATGVNYTPVLDGSNVSVYVTATQGATTLTSATVTVYARSVVDEELVLSPRAPMVGDEVESISPEVTGAETWNWYLSGQEGPLGVHSESILVVDAYVGQRLQARLDTTDKASLAPVTYYSYLTDVIPDPGVSVMADDQPLNQVDGDYIAYYGQTLKPSAMNVAEATGIGWTWNEAGSETGRTHEVALGDVGYKKPLRLTCIYGGDSTTLVERYIQYRIAAPSITIDYEEETITAEHDVNLVPTDYVLYWDGKAQTAGCYTVKASPGSPGSEPQKVYAMWVHPNPSAGPSSERTTVIIPARPSTPAITASVSPFTITVRVVGDDQVTDGEYSYARVNPTDMAPDVNGINSTGVFTDLSEGTEYYFAARKNAVEGESFASEWKIQTFTTSVRTVLDISDAIVSYNPNLRPQDVPVTLKKSDGESVTLTYGTDYTIQTPFPTFYPSWPGVLPAESDAYPCVIHLTAEAWQTYKFSDDFGPVDHATFYLKITPADIKDASVTLNNATYDGQVKSVVVKVKIGDNEYTLEEGKDYEVTLPAGVTEMKNAGEYTVTITGKGNYKGEKEVTLTINPKSLDADINPGNNIYNGTTNVDTSNWSVSSLTGVVEGDDVSASISGVSIADKNAAVNKEAQVFLQLAGDDATNYALPTATTVTFELKKAPLTIELRDIGRYYEGAATGDDVIPLNHIRVYDALPSNSPEAVLVSSLEFDKVTFGLRVNGAWRALRPDEESSTWSVSVADILTEEAQKNYSVESDTVTGKLYIYPRYMPVTLTMTDRAYDGTKKIDYTYSYDSDYELVSDPVDSIHADCTVQNAAVGTMKPVWADNVYVVSNGKANYNYNVVLPTDAAPKVNITQKELSVDVTATGKTYDGTCDVKLSVSNVTGICGSDQVTITATGKAVSSDVGEQTVEVNLESNNTNYTAVQKGTTKVNIKKKTLTIGGAATLTYTGKTELSLAGITSLTLDGVLTGDKVNLDLTDATATVADPKVGTGKSAAVQGATLSGAGAGNYVLTDAALCIVNIVKAKAPAIQWPTASAITYGDELSASTLTSADLNGTFEWQNKTAILFAGEQTQTVVYTPKDTSNYDYTGVTLTHDISVTVNKAATVIDVSGVQTAYSYTGALQTVNTGAKLNHSEATPAYTNNTFTTVKEGNGLVVTISALESENYLPAETTVTLTVNKAAAPDIQWPTASAITYGDELSASKLTSDDSGSFRWAKPETKLPAGAQKQTVVYTPKDAENYDYTGVALEKEIDVTVNKAATVIDVSGVQTSYTYTGTLQTVNTGATLNHSEAAPVYTNNTFTTVKEGDGLVVTITVPETANYLSAEATVTLKVTRAKAPTIEWPEVSPITYGEPLSKIELKGGSSDLGTFVWEDGSEIPGAGVPTRKLIFTPSDTENYEWPETQFSKDITVQVAKRQVTITVEDAEKTYGDPDPVWEYSVNGLLPGATLSVTVTREKGEAADTYELRAEYTVLENYEIQAVSGKLTIHPRSLDELTIDSIPTQRYTGQVLRPRPTIKDGNTELVPDRDYTLTYSGAVGPGKGKITITGKGNYTGERTITFDINDPALDHLRNALGDIGTGTTTRVVIDPQGLPMDYDLIDAPGAGTDPDDRLLLIRANNDTDDTRILSLSGTQLNALVSSRTLRLLAFENAGAVAVLDVRDLLAVASDVNLTAEQRAQVTYEVRIVPVTEPVAAIDISVWMCWPDGELELTPSLTTLQVGLAVDGANNRTDLCRLNDDGIPEVQDSELMTLPADLLEEGTTMDWYHVTVLPDGTIQITERQREPLSYVRLEVLSTSPAQGGRYLLQERSQNEQE